MKSDFLLAITQLSAEKNLPKQVIIATVEAALVSAYRKDSFAPNQDISVKINPASGKVEVWAEKAVVETPTDTRCEVSLEEAHKFKPDAQSGDSIMVEATPRNAGRIAAQTAKQVILQRLHEAEHSAIFEEYAGREGDIVTGVVQRVESKQILVDLGRTEAVLPAIEQVRNERYRVGQRLKVHLLEVMPTGKGPQVIVSRSHPDLLRRLFELEIPEVYNGIVEIKSVAREAGYRSKVAVVARQEGIDPVGCCVGLRGIRIQNIVRELNGEKIDVVIWSQDTSAFIANALSPAQVVNIELNEEEGVATVIVPDRQLSLAIGKEGQNVRLAAKLSGWRIDVKGASTAEAERIAEAKPLVEEAMEIVEEGAVEEELPAEVPAMVAGEATGVVEEAEPSPVLETPFAPPPVPTEGETQIRFAEDILVSKPAKPGVRTKKKKKKKDTYSQKSEDGIKTKKPRRGKETPVDEDEEGYEY